LTQTWLCLTHVGNFCKPGDYLTFNIADYPIFLVMGKDNILRGFHDVCRHRAYKVTRKPTGSALVLGCKYHGWCYDTKGKLIKAPQFDNVKGFNKSENGLFEIQVRVDANGFVFVSLDPKTVPIDTESVLQNIDDCRRLRGLDGTASPIVSWDLKAEFNWKLTEESYMNVNILRPPSFAGGLLSQLLFDTGRGNLLQKKVFRNAVAVEVSKTLWCLITLLPTSARQTITRVEIISTRPMAKAVSNDQVHEGLRAHIWKDLRVLEDKYEALRSEQRYRNSIFR
jgi:nitrite reductase/ring-hydroxylating ferredoxin subunit